jgi:hypothetical protein
VERGTERFLILQEHFARRRTDDADRLFGTQFRVGTDNGLTTRTWSDALTSITDSKSGPKRERWERVATDNAHSGLWDLVIIETRAEMLFQAMQTGTVLTNVYLRRIHNFCVDMNWLAWPLIPKRQ